MERTVPGLLDHALATHPDRTAVTYRSDRFSFADLHGLAAATAAEIATHGVRPGDRVGICLRPSIAQPITQLAASLAGAIVVPMHPNLRAGNLAHVARDAGLTALIVDATRAGELAAACPGVLVLPVSGTVDDNGRVLGTPVGRIGTRETTEEDLSRLAMLIYSSGSTGRPKGIRVTHENLVRGAEIVSGYLGTSRDDRIAGLLTLNFDYGLNQLWQALLVGASLHLHDFVMPRTAFRLLDEERITAFPVMPALVQRLFADRLGGPPQGLDLSSVRYVCSSGGAVSDWALRQLEATFPNADIVLMYGLTEAFRSSYLPPDQLHARPTSIGKAVPGVTLHVLDDNGEDCAPGEIGTLVHRNGCVSDGYWRNPEATARVFRHYDRFPGETVVWTGDLASCDADGYFYVQGRADAQLKRDGFRISPNDVEAILADHPAVADAVVLGLPDGDRGHRLIVFWTARPGYTEDDQPAQAWLVENLPPYMVPSEFRHLERFPTTSNQGKADRIALADMLRAETETAPTTGPAVASTPA